MRLENGTWVLVIDGSKALVLENVTDGQDPNLQVVRKDENEAPDNRGESTAAPEQQGIRRQLDASDYHQATEAGFAEEMAEWLYKAAHRGRFQSLVLVAPDKVLGTLRGALHKEVAQKVVGEVHKTLTGHPVDQIEKIVMQELATA